MDDGLSEQDLFSESPADAARRILKESAPFAAGAITKMALDETISPSVRLRAAQYVVDRELGPVGGGDDESRKLEAFLEEMAREANQG